MNPNESTPTPTELYEALLPLVGEAVRAAIVTNAGHPVAVLFGRFNGNVDIDPNSDQCLSLDVEDQLIDIAVHQLVAIEPFNRTVIDGEEMCGVAIELEGGTTIELEPDLIAFSTTL